MTIFRSELDPLTQHPDVYVSAAGRQRGSRLLAAGGARHVVIDVDGCFTPGYQIVDVTSRKPVKVFGLDDYAAVTRWAEHVGITAVTSDYSPVTVARFRTWGVRIENVPAAAEERVNAIECITSAPSSAIVYVGDGYYDADVMRHCGFGIAPANAWPGTLRAADAITSRPGGQRAVAQALDFTGENLLGSPGQQ